jgi:hypothetical protein
MSDEPEDKDISQAHIVSKKTVYHEPEDKQIQPMDRVLRFIESETGNGYLATQDLAPHMRNPI